MLIYVCDRRQGYRIEEAQEITIDDSSEDPLATYDDFLKELKSVCLLFNLLFLNFVYFF